jgi:Zn finger protein HypA/HybF involved in hydrogenase expression
LMNRLQVGESRLMTSTLKFKCNGCARKTEFIWLDIDVPKGFGVYQCRDCGAVGTKNLAEQVDNDSKVSRCNQCGSWQFEGKECHTCLMLM